MSPKVDVPQVTRGTKIRVCIGRVVDGDRGPVEKWRDAEVKSVEPDGRVNVLISTVAGDERVLGPAAIAREPKDNPTRGHYEASNLDHARAHREGGTNPGMSWLTVDEYATAYAGAAVVGTPTATSAAKPAAPKAPKAAPVAKTLPTTKPPPPSIVRTPAPPPVPDAPPAAPPVDPAPTTSGDVSDAELERLTRPDGEGPPSGDDLGI